MKKLSIVLIGILILVNPVGVYSETPVGPTPEENSSEDTEIENVTSPFDINLSLGTQSPWSKKVPVIISFVPAQDSDRIEVALDLPLGLRYERNYDQYFAVNAGQVYEVEALVEPINPGDYTVTANITDWGYGTNQTSSESIKVSFNENLITEPKTENYTVMVGVKYGIYILIIAGIGVGLYFGGKIGIERLKEWLKPPE